MGVLLFFTTYIIKNIMDKLLKTQQNLQINNNIYLRLEQHRNHSDLFQVNLNPASNFEQNMFTFLDLLVIIQLK